MPVIVVFIVGIPIIFASYAWCFLRGYDCGVEDTRRLYEAIRKANQEDGDE